MANGKNDRQNPGIRSRFRLQSWQCPPAGAGVTGARWSCACRENASR